MIKIRETVLVEFTGTDETPFIRICQIIDAIEIRTMEAISRSCMKFIMFKQLNSTGEGSFNRFMD